MSVYLGNIEIQNGTYLGNINIQENTISMSAIPDIVREGLIFAYDWSSFNSNGTLTDKSGNNYTASWFGNLTTSSNALQFDGTSSYIAFDINANSMYQSWKWTVDTYGTIYDIDTVSNVGQSIAYNNTDSSTSFPEWAFSLKTSGSLTPEITAYNQLIAEFISPITASLIIPHQFTYLGRQSGSSGSEISASFDTQPLVRTSGNAFNEFPGRSFNGNGAFPGAATSSSLQYFGGPEVNYSSPFGIITWSPLSGSIQYILYYNRDLTDAELKQNNAFYLRNNQII